VEVKKKRTRLRCGLPQLADDDFPFGGNETPPQPSFVEVFDPALFDQQSSLVPRHDPGDFARREKYTDPGPEKEIDLHGLTAQEAERKVENFLRTARLQGLRAVRIITGKGIHSPGMPVLPEMMERLAREMKGGGEIRSFAWEKGQREKSGAMLIFL
jgi:DNA-nicking Smr family endonuclease